MAFPSLYPVSTSQSWSYLIMHSCLVIEYYSDQRPTKTDDLVGRHLQGLVCYQGEASNRWDASNRSFQRKCYLYGKPASLFHVSTILGNSDFGIFWQNVVYCWGLQKPSTPHPRVPKYVHNCFIITESQLAFFVVLFLSSNNIWHSSMFFNSNNIWVTKWMYTNFWRFSRLGFIFVVNLYQDHRHQCWLWCLRLAETCFALRWYCRIEELLCSMHLVHLLCDGRKKISFNW